jgi:hypothetical protein
VRKTDHYNIVAIGDQSRRSPRILLTVLPLGSVQQACNQSTKRSTDNRLVCPSRKLQNNLLNKDYNEKLFNKDYTKTVTSENYDENLFSEDRPTNLSSEVSLSCKEC